jgi:hypothetical protein
MAGMCTSARAGAPGDNPAARQTARVHESGMPESDDDFTGVSFVGRMTMPHPRQSNPEQICRAAPPGLTTERAHEPNRWAQKEDRTADLQVSLDRFFTNG